MHLPGFLVKIFAKPYVSGDTVDKGIARADQLWNEEGIYSTLDLLGEEVTTDEEVEENITTYLEVADKVQGKEYITVSYKPSSLGSHNTDEYLISNLRKILDYYTEKGVELTLDMEDQSFTDLTLKIYFELLEKYPSYGTVIQSRLFRTEEDIILFQNKKGRVRTCIGIYNESKEIAFTNKSEMKQKLLKFSQYLIENGSYVEFATHDQKTLLQMLDLAKESEWTGDHLEFQQLLGVPMRTTQKILMENGFKVRLYVPFAVNWKYALPYLKRRLANNPKMAFYVIKHMFGRA
jgi:proline dehydrogenase